MSKPMSTNTPAANSSYGRAESDIKSTVESFVESVTTALADTEADETAVKAVEDQGRRLAEHVGRTVDELRDDVEDTRDEQQETRRQQAEDRKRISEVEERLDDTTPTPDDEETTIQNDDTTPIERLAVADDVEDVTDSVSVERAVSLFRNLADWGVKTPKGICLRPADNPLQLLEADRDESLAWKQYYRAAKVLERLSKGAVTFFDSDRHGKMIVLHEKSDVFDRVVNGGLSPSSAGAEV